MEPSVTNPEALAEEFRQLIKVYEGDAEATHPIPSRRGGYAYWLLDDQYSLDGYDHRAADEVKIGEVEGEPCLYMRQGETAGWFRIEGNELLFNRYKLIKCSPRFSLTRRSHLPINIEHLDIEPTDPSNNTGVEENFRGLLHILKQD